MFNVRFTGTLAAAACIAAVGLSAPVAQAADSRGASGYVTFAGLEQHRPLGAAPTAALRASASENALVFERFAGKDRYTTAVEISKAHFPNATWPADPDKPDEPPAPVDSVVIASGYNYPDALSGGNFAAGLGPLLLVPGKGTVPAAVKAEIKRLNPQYVYIMGGTGAVGTDVETQLKPFGEIRRFDGNNRYDTAAWVGVNTSDKVGGATTVVLASGEGFADALGGGSSASNQEGVLLLTRAGTLSPETRAALQDIAPTKVQVLGGPTVITNGVINSVKTAVPGVTVQRVYGADRAATAAAVSKVTFPVSSEQTFFVNGWNYPDALAAAPLAWFWQGSVLMSRTQCAPAATLTEDARLTPDYRAAIGGTGAVSDAALKGKRC